MTGGTSGEFSQLLLGLCAGVLLAMAAAMLRAPRAVARWSGFAFFLTSACFAIKLWGDGNHAFSPELRCVIGVMAMTSVGWFWLMCMALFADCDEYRPSAFAAPGALLVVGILYQIPPHPIHPWIAALGTLMQVGLTIASMVIVVRSWKDDLVESRRRMRGPFMVAVALYILSVNAFDILALFGSQMAVPDWYPMVNAGLLALVTLCGALTFLDPRSEMFGGAEAPSLPPQPELAVLATPVNGAANGKAHANGNGAAVEIDRAALDRAAKADLDRLECLMLKDQIWREEGLTIASLALRAQMPETQLRRLINDCLGYRNFPSYVNAHRIAAAKSRLADPNEARVSISTIAYDIGFASLGPFNRAFKEETGASPSEWRRKELGLPSPISEEV